MAKESVFCLLVSVSLPLGGGGLGVFGVIEMGVLTFFTLPAWRMLHARGQWMTFCSDHIHNYYHHYLSSNRAENYIHVRHQPAKNGWQFQCTSKVESGLKTECVVCRFIYIFYLN